MEKAGRQNGPAHRCFLSLPCKFSLSGKPDVLVGVTMKNTHSTILVTALTPFLAHADLVGQWSLDEGTGVTANDSTANARNGTLSGGTSWSTTDLAPVPSGTTAHLEFNGSTSIVTINGYKGVTGTGDRTVAAWIRSSDPIVNRSIVSWGANVGGEKWTFRTQSDNGTAGAIRLEVNGGYFVGNTVVTDGEWHHVAVTWANDGTPDVIDAKIYVDGVLDADLSTPTALPSASQSRAINTASNADVKIGDDFQTTRFWNGGIDEVRIYDEALDAAAIANLAMGAPLINDFSTSTEVVSSGGPAVLSWDTDPANDTLTIDNGIGDVSGASMFTVNPTVDTTYTLTATRGVVTSERSVTVLVESAPIVNDFGFFGSGTIVLGQSATLFWDTIAEAGITLNGQDVAGLSEFEVNPTETTTYVLAATNSFGTTEQEVTITVVDPNAPTVEWVAEGQAEGALAVWSPAINTTFNNSIAWGNGNLANVVTGTSNFPFVNTWVNSADYNLTGSPGTSWHTALGDLITKEDVTWELVFRPGDFTGTHTLFNTGGNGFGTGIVLQGSTVDFRVQSANNNDQRVILPFDLSTIGEADEFYHLVATVDIDPVAPAVVSLYINGNLVAGPVSSVSAIVDWDGSDLAELGRGANIPTSTTFPFETFTGDVASFAYFESKLLDAPAVESRYNDLTGGGSEFTITNIVYDDSVPEVRITFTSVNGRSYALETTTDLSAEIWLELDDAIDGQADQTTVAVGAPFIPGPDSLRRFFRIRPGVQ